MVIRNNEIRNNAPVSFFARWASKLEKSTNMPLKKFVVPYCLRLIVFGMVAIVC